MSREGLLERYFFLFFLHQTIRINSRSSGTIESFRPLSRLDRQGQRSLTVRDFAGRLMELRLFEERIFGRPRPVFHWPRGTVLKIRPRVSEIGFERYEVQFYSGTIDLYARDLFHNTPVMPVQTLVDIFFAALPVGSGFTRAQLVALGPVIARCLARNIETVVTEPWRQGRMNMNVPAIPYPITPLESSEQFNRRIQAIQRGMPEHHRGVLEEITRMIQRADARADARANEVGWTLRRYCGWVTIAIVVFIMMHKLCVFIVRLE